MNPSTFTELSDLDLSALYGRASTDRQDGSLETQVSTARITPPSTISASLTS